MAEKKKWDDEEEGRKPWEEDPKKKKPKAPAGGTPAPMPKTPGPGSAAEDNIGELDRRNKEIVDKYGEPVPKKKKKRR